MTQNKAIDHIFLCDTGTLVAYQGTFMPYNGLWYIKQILWVWTHYSVVVSLNPGRWTIFQIKINKKLCAWKYKKWTKNKIGMAARIQIENMTGIKCPNLKENIFFNLEKVCVRYSCPSRAVWPDVGITSSRKFQNLTTAFYLKKWHFSK